MATAKILGRDEARKSMMLCLKRGNADSITTLLPRLNDTPIIMTADAGRQMIAKCHEGDSESFSEFIGRLFQNPLQPIDDLGKRRYHPVLVSAVTYAVLAIILLAGIACFWTSKK